MNVRQISGCQRCTCPSGQAQLRKPHQHPSVEDEESKDKEEKELVIPIIECGSHVCIAEPCAKDIDKVESQMKLANRVWKMSRPPHGFSRPIPTVTARRIQITRAQLLGQLTGSPISSVPCPPSTCPQSSIDPRRSKVPDTNIIFEASTSQRKKTISGTNFC